MFTNLQKFAWVWERFFFILKFGFSFVCIVWGRKDDGKNEMEWMEWNGMKRGLVWFASCGHGRTSFHVGWVMTGLGRGSLLLWW